MSIIGLQKTDPSPPAQIEIRSSSQIGCSSSSSLFLFHHSLTKDLWPKKFVPIIKCSKYYNYIILQDKFQSSYTTPMRDALLRGDWFCDEHVTLAKEILQKQNSEIMEDSRPFCHKWWLYSSHMNGNHWCTLSPIGQ